MPRRDKPAGGAVPPWLITYCDLMTLLLTFFLLLISMAVIDERSKREVLGSVNETFGMHRRLFNPLGSPGKSSSRAPGAMEAPDEDLAPMRDMLFEDVEKDLQFQENKYVQIFSISDEVLFSPGGTTLSPRGIALLDRILPYLQQINYPLLVAGHTGPRRDEQGTAYKVEFEEKTADDTWLLSFRRGASVYRHLTERGIAPERLSQEAFGQFHPRFTNNTPEGRQKNRRVDLVLDKRNQEWIKKVEGLRAMEPEVAREHYYRGFRFDLAPPGTTPEGRP